MIIEIEVTDEDIRQGQESKRRKEDVCYTCAIARAVARKLNVPKVEWGYNIGFSRPGVQDIKVIDEEQSVVWSFVVDHDAFKPVKPFTFHLQVVPA